MELLIPAMIAIALIWYFMNRPATTKDVPPRGSSTSTQEFNANNELSWLRERWKLAETHRAEGKVGVFPSWFFDEVTERQRAKLVELGITTGPEVTKGQASDLIGIHYPPDPEDLEMLKFFKLSKAATNQTRARHEVASLLENPENAAAWASRPPSRSQKEFFLFFGIKPEKGLTAEQAEKLIRLQQQELEENNDPRLDEWDAFEEILDEIFDPEVRADYDLKKPSRSLVKSALNELKSAGHTYRAIADDIDILINKLVEMKPDLQLD